MVIGSAAIFLWEEEVPDAMAMSREADLFATGVGTAEAERISDELDAILGQASSFDATYGYYCDGVGEATAILPSGLESPCQDLLQSGDRGSYGRGSGIQTIWL
ncbi:hypothetical protein ACRAWD_12585 [Caulobacter segnis]